jgi:hypothetical protein
MSKQFQKTLWLASEKVLHKRGQKSRTRCLRWNGVRVSTSAMVVTRRSRAERTRLAGSGQLTSSPRRTVWLEVPIRAHGKPDTRALDAGEKECVHADLVSTSRTTLLDHPYRRRDQQNRSTYPTNSH